MFKALKAKSYIFFAVLAASLSVYIKMLRASVKRKAKEIGTLKQNAETQKRVHAGDIKRERFDSAQAAKSKDVIDESTLNEINEKRGKISESDNFTIVDS